VSVSDSNLNSPVVGKVGPEDGRQLAEPWRLQPRVVQGCVVEDRVFEERQALEPLLHVVVVLAAADGLDAGVAHLDPIPRLLNLQLQRQRCSRLERFYIRAK
jgi:hypothetical protein